MKLLKVTGFETFDPCVTIFDAHGKMFLYFENDKGKRYTFNLPSGEYEIVNDIVELVRPLQYVSPTLPRKEKDIRIAETLDITIENNPNKATFKNWTGEMSIDHSIWDKSIPERRFVMGHELGHNLYYTEWKCDVFSASTMLKEGFNPSQCYYANEFCLSNKGSSKKRKDILFTFLKNTKCYE